MKKLCMVLCMMAVCAQAAASDSVIYFNNTARPLGMGGAFTAAVDENHNHLYNPAATWFPEDNTVKVSWSFDAVRGLYIAIKLAEEWDFSGEDSWQGYLMSVILLSTSQIRIDNRNVQFKFNFMDQLITPGMRYPMYVSSFTGSYRFTGLLRGFQVGATGHMYNLFNSADPFGLGYSVGVHYHSQGHTSPFTIGAFYFHAPDNLPNIRSPFERIQNNTFNIGATYEMFRQYTLSFDLRNISNYSIVEIAQPHIGLEKVFKLRNPGEVPTTLGVRVGAYWNSDSNAVGRSLGFSFRKYFHSFEEKARPGYFYADYSYTKEEHLWLTENNHIISIGVTL
jgi:hypothetical protein